MKMAKPFFGLNNRLSAIIIAFFIFGFTLYTAVNEGVISPESLTFIRYKDASSSTYRKAETMLRVKYSFESTSTSMFGLYEHEITIVKICTGFLLFITLLVGATQRSKILLRIWMMIQAFVIILSFLATVMTVMDNTVHHSGAPTQSLAKFTFILLCSIWFSFVVLSLHEEIEVNHRGETGIESTVRSCAYVSKKGQDVEGKCPPYYDC